MPDNAVPEQPCLVCDPGKNVNRGRSRPMSTLGRLPIDAVRRKDRCPVGSHDALLNLPCRAIGKADIGGICFGYGYRGGSLARKPISYAVAPIILNANQTYT